MRKCGCAHDEDEHFLVAVDTGSGPVAMERCNCSILLCDCTKFRDQEELAKMHAQYGVKYKRKERL